MVSRVVNMLIFNGDVLLLWIGAWSTCRDSTRVFYCLGFESGQHVEIRMTTFYYSGFESCRCVDILLLCSSILNSRVVNMLRFCPCFLLPWSRDWSSCWDYSGYVLLFWVWEWSTCWYSISSRVVNMLRFYQCVLLPRIRELSTSWDSNDYVILFGVESGQHVGIQLRCAFMLDSRVVNMLTLYPCVPLPWIWEWSTWIQPIILDARVVNMLSI